jgi:hypothetical protein
VGSSGEGPCLAASDTRLGWASDRSTPAPRHSRMRPRRLPLPSPALQ